MIPLMTRRSVMAAASLAWTVPAHAATPLRTFKNPGCACCDGWADHMRKAGYSVRVTETPNLDGIRASAGVPSDLAGCHTTLFGTLAAEGHVPAAAIGRLLAAPANWRGLAVAGMPIGSPGMEVPNEPAETYDIWAFATDGTRRLFAQAKGVVIQPV